MGHNDFGMQPVSSRHTTVLMSSLEPQIAHRVLTRVVSKIVLNYLVGGLEHVLFSIIYGIVLPIDFHIFQDG